MRLAYTIAHCFARAAILYGWEPPEESLVEPDHVSYHYLRSITGIQPKASKLPPVVSEFKLIIPMVVSPTTQPPVQAGQCLTSDWHSIPRGACFLAKPPARLTKGDDQKVVSDPSKTTWYFGIFRTPQEFVNDAVAVGHPISNSCVLPNVLQEAVRCIRYTPTHVLANERLHTLRRWVEKARNLHADESRLRDLLPPSLAHILKPKRLLLWKSMLEHYKYPDLAVFDEVVSGTVLTGVAPHVQCFDQSFKPAKMTVSDLESSAESSRVSILRSTRSSGDAEIDEEVYTKTRAEVDSGWLNGPYSRDSPFRSYKSQVWHSLVEWRDIQDPAH